MALDYLEQIGQAREKIKTLADTALGKVSQAFAEEAIKEMRDTVPTASKTLQSSIGLKFSQDGDILSYEFLADDYWDFINSGVDGVQQSAGAIINQFGNTYSYKTLNPSKKMVDAFSGGDSMQNWLASKGITSLTFDGKTKHLVTDADYKAAAYVLARGTKKHGIKPTPFINNAFTEDKMQAFEEALLDAFETII